MVHLANGATLNISTPTPNSYRAIKVLATASICGVDLKIAEGFKFGVDNVKEEYLKKFPLGQIPTLELPDGFTLAQSDAITQFISTDAFLRKDCPKANALVLQYVNFASHEVNAAQTTLCYPALGISQLEKAKASIAKQKLDKYLAMLNGALEKNTFLVGERITLADVTVACELILPLKLVVEPVTLDKYPHVKRWFITMVNQPALKRYIGDYEFCVKAKQFDAKRYNELHPKDAKAQSTTSTKSAAKEQTPAKDVAPPAKKKDVFAHLAPTTFSLDSFKKLEGNASTLTQAIPYLWENFDNDGFSFWFCEYKHDDELTFGFMAKNFIRNTLEGLNVIRNYLYASFFILGTDKNYKVKGLFLQRGQDLIFNLDHDAIFDADVFSFRKLDIKNADDKKIIETYVNKTDETVGGLPVAELLQHR